MMRLGAKPGFVWIESPVMVAYRQHAGAATQDVTRTYQGMEHLLRQERAGRYPGGTARALERRRILTQHVRSFSLTLARQGERKKAWTLFRATLGWNLRLGRVKYLLGMLVVFALGWVRRTRVR